MYTMYFPFLYSKNVISYFHCKKVRPTSVEDSTHASLANFPCFVLALLCAGLGALGSDSCLESIQN